VLGENNPDRPIALSGLFSFFCESKCQPYTDSASSSLAIIEFSPIAREVTLLNLVHSTSWNSLFKIPGLNSKVDALTAMVSEVIIPLTTFIIF